MGGWIPVGEARTTPSCQQPCQGLSPFLCFWFINVRSCLIIWASRVACASPLIRTDCFHKWWDLFFLWLLCKYFFIWACFPVLPAAPKWLFLWQEVSPRFWWLSWSYRELSGRLHTSLMFHSLITLFLQLELFIFLMWDLQSLVLSVHVPVHS